MHPINRALAFIEDHLSEDLGVDEIARASFISRYHLSHVFATATGYPPWRYVMLRRLTEAARLLRQTERGILEIALEVGYDSHSVFSRAFRAEFGIRPSEFRRDGAPVAALVQPIIWSEQMSITVATPQERHGLSLTAVGMSRQFRPGDDVAVGHAALAKAWRPRYPEIRRWESSPGYIQMSRSVGESFTLFMGVTVSEVEDLPEDLERVDVNWDRYLVFPFSLESARLGDLVTAIYAEWFPNHAKELEPASGDHLQLFKASPELEALEPGTEIPPTLTMEGEFWVPVR